MSTTSLQILQSTSTPLVERCFQIDDVGANTDRIIYFQSHLWSVFEEEISGLNDMSSQYKTGETYTVDELYSLVYEGLQVVKRVTDLVHRKGMDIYEPGSQGMKFNNHAAGKFKELRISLHYIYQVLYPNGSIQSIENLCNKLSQWQENNIPKS